MKINGKYFFLNQVGWLKIDTQTILAMKKRVVTHNSRVSVTHDEHRTWYLHIKTVKEKDRGCYMCQINTPVMKYQIGCIQVHGEGLKGKIQQNFRERIDMSYFANRTGYCRSFQEYLTIIHPSTL